MFPRKYVSLLRKLNNAFTGKEKKGQMLLVTSISVHGFYVS